MNVKEPGESDKLVASPLSRCIYSTADLYSPVRAINLTTFDPVSLSVCQEYEADLPSMSCVSTDDRSSGSIRFIRCQVHVDLAWPSMWMLISIDDPHTCAKEFVVHGKNSNLRGRPGTTKQGRKGSTEGSVKFRA